MAEKKDSKMEEACGETFAYAKKAHDDMRNPDKEDLPYTSKEKLMSPNSGKETEG